MKRPELLRIEGFARWRIQGLGRRSMGRTYEDLVGEAIHATLDGRRSWNKENVDFVGHLYGAIQSISDNWGRKFKEHEAILESEVANGSSETFARAAVVAPTQEHEIAARQREDEIAAMFDDDPIVTLIICELKSGTSLRDIRTTFALSANEFEAALKRLRRRIARSNVEKSHA